MKQKLIFPKKYASSIEVESVPMCRVSYELINEGSDDQTIKFFITGRAPRNKWKKVGTVRIVAADNDAANFLLHSNTVEFISDKTHDMDQYPTDEPFVIGGQTIKKGNMFVNSPTFENIDTDNESGSLRFKLNKITRSNPDNDPDYQDGVKQVDFLTHLGYNNYVDDDHQMWLKPAAYAAKDINGEEVVRPIIAYTYDILYKSKGRTSRANSIKYRLDYKASLDKNNKTGPGGIRDIIFNPEIKPSGENKKFEVVGTPGSYFTIMLTENTVQDINEFGKSRINGQHTILSNPLNKKVYASLHNDDSFHPVVTLGDGTEVEAITGRIPNNGKFVFYHRFDPYPPNVNNNFYKNYAISVLNRWRYRDVKANNAWDVNLQKEIPYTQFDLEKWNGGRKKVEDFKVKNKGSVLKFHDRLDRYPIDQEDWETADLIQRYDPILTLCATLTTGENIMAQVNGLPANWPAATSFNHNHPICASFLGRYKDASGKIYQVMDGTAGVPTQDPWIDMVYKFYLVPKSPTLAWTIDRDPKFSRVNANESDWSNSMPNSYTMSVGSPTSEQTFPGNGGMKIDMQNITIARSTTTNANDTLTIGFRVYVLNWGTDNVTMTLNMNDLVTIS